MKVSFSRKNRGFAVIIALVAITVLALLAGTFAYSMKVETCLAANANNDEAFYWIGRGGVERACWWKALDGNQPFSSKLQYWAGGPGDGPETNSPLASESLDNFPIGPGTVSLTFTELESQINVNTAAAPLIQQVLNTMGVDANDVSVVSDSILDWIDADDDTRPAGAESDYYQGLNPPYLAKNAPMDRREELLLVKGVTYNMYYGISSAGSQTPYPEHKLGFGHAPGKEPDYAFGLRDVFTPFSSGKINLLTVNNSVLLSILDNDPNAVQAINTARGSDPPIRDVNQLLAAAGVNPAAFGPFQPYVGNRGDVYEVVATATISGISHEYTAIIYRKGSNVQVVSFYRTK
jgi:general secretion pathway protein K